MCFDKEFFYCAVELGSPYSVKLEFSAEGPEQLFAGIIATYRNDPKLVSRYSEVIDRYCQVLEKLNKSEKAEKLREELANPEEQQA